MKTILDTFNLWSGQQVNRNKSTLVFSPNTSHDLRMQLSSSLGVNFSSRLGKYLGSHVDPGRNKQIVYEQVLSAIQRRTATWKTQLLSQASRLQLIKSVLSSANIYLLTCILLPDHICHQIDARMVNFSGVNRGSQKRCTSPRRMCCFSQLLQEDLVYVIPPTLIWPCSLSNCGESSLPPILLAWFHSSG